MIQIGKSEGSPRRKERGAIKLASKKEIGEREKRRAGPPPKNVNSRRASERVSGPIGACTTQKFGRRIEDRGRMRKKVVAIFWAEVESLPKFCCISFNFIFTHLFQKPTYHYKLYLQWPLLLSEIFSSA